MPIYDFDGGVAVTFSVSLTVSVSHVENASSTSVKIVDNNAGTTVADTSINGTTYYSVFTNQSVSFKTADGRSGVLTCSVRQNTQPFFTATMTVEGKTVGSCELGTSSGSNSSYGWSGSHNFSGIFTLSSPMHEIAKVFDYDGTTHHQIAKVYDWDGTAALLIMSAEQSLLDASASASGGLSAGSLTQIATADTVWNVVGFNSLTLTWRNDMSVYYWTNPAGSYTNGSRSCWLVLSDGTEVLVGEGDTGTATVDLSQYTDTQKTAVKLRGKLQYYLSTATNAANKGSITATNVIAS